MKLNNYLNSASDKRLNYFMDTLSTTNRTPEYYVNWNKVETNTKKYELELNTLNYLIGKDNIISEARTLFLKQPDLLKAIPSLIAARERELDVLIIDDKDNMGFFNIDFADIDLTNIEEYIDFIQDTGLFDFLKNHAQKSLVDFVYGIETGLDSNARKNRSGETMENVLERNVKKHCNQLGYKYKIEATATWIKNNWGIDVPVDKSDRRFDAAIYDDIKNEIYVIETNYYGGGGSKLKSVAGEFKSLNHLVNGNDIHFVWVTDGQGWHTARTPLAEAFADINYIFNLEMLRKEFIYDLIK